MSEDFEKEFLSVDFPSLMRDRQPVKETKSGQELPFKVYVDDNHNYMDASARTLHGAFQTAKEAVSVCMDIVRESVLSNFKPGMTARELFDRYKDFGDDPFIVAESGADIRFSAWEYARHLCIKTCGK